MVTFAIAFEKKMDKLPGHWYLNYYPLIWRSRFKNDLSLTIIEKNSKVIIRTSDTDVLVIALGCLEHIPEYINLWLEVGFYAKKSLRYIDIRKLFNKLWKDLSRFLPAFHVFTGSDYTATFSNKGKICALKTLEKHKQFKLYWRHGILWYYTRRRIQSNLKVYLCLIWKTKI